MNQSNTFIRLPLGCSIDMLNTSDSTYRLASCLQYKDRFNEHRRTADKQANISKPTAVSEHFLSNDHTATNMQLIPLELVKTKRDGVRKAREDREVYLERGQTLEPLGLNRRDET